MRFAYLIQGKSDLVRGLCSLSGGDADVLTLTYDCDIPKFEVSWTAHIFAPGTTWAEGRNLLLREAQARGAYDYYIFLDDDVRVVRGSFSEFEMLLALHKPAVGLPLCDEIKRTNRYDPGAVMQHPVALDQIVQAFSADAVAEGIVVPYVTRFDDDSWWYACEINQFLVLRYYRDRTLQFNDFEILNAAHTWVAGESSEPSSTYRGGTDEAGMRRIRSYIEDRFGAQPPVEGTLFDASRSSGSPLRMLRRLLRGAPGLGSRIEKP